MDEIKNKYYQQAETYYLVEQAILYISQHYQQQPSLEEVAGWVGLSEFHFQRLFTEWVGISPKRFLQFITKEQVKKRLINSENMLKASIDVGLSGPGRLHDLFIVCEAVTPGEFKNRGSNLKITFGIHPTPFGNCLIGVTDRGICQLAFVAQNQEQRSILEFQEAWPNANLEEDQGVTGKLIEQIFTRNWKTQGQKLRLFLRGTNFQLKVWEALLQIPMANLVSYEYIATEIGRPNATRAVGNAVGRNPLAYLIPCHRVIRKVGDFGSYRYGSARKKAILGWEMAQNDMEMHYEN